MNDYEDYYGGYYGHKVSRMSTAAVVLGIVAIFTCSAFYIALPCGAIAVICAILSRTNHAMTGRGKIGIACGTIGIVISLALTAYSAYYLMTNESGRAYLEDFYRSYTGDSDFELEEVFPFLGGDDDEEEEEEEAKPVQPDENSDEFDGGEQGTPNERPGDSYPDQPQDSPSVEGGFV